MLSRRLLRRYIRRAPNVVLSFKPWESQRQCALCGSTRALVTDHSARLGQINWFCCVNKKECSKRVAQKERVKS